MRKASDIMRFWLILSAIILCGCSPKKATESSALGSQEALDRIFNSISKERKLKSDDKIAVINALEGGTTSTRVKAIICLSEAKSQKLIEEQEFLRALANCAGNTDDVSTISNVLSAVLREYQSWPPPDGTLRREMREFVRNQKLNKLSPSDQVYIEKLLASNSPGARTLAGWPMATKKSLPAHSRDAILKLINKVRGKASRKEAMFWSFVRTIVTMRNK